MARKRDKLSHLVQVARIRIETTVVKVSPQRLRHAEPEDLLGADFGTLSDRVRLSSSLVRDSIVARPAARGQ